LEILKAKEPGRSVVLVVECGFMGILPSMLNAPGIKPNAHITVGVLPLSLSSIDTAPFGYCLPPDSSPSGRARNAMLNSRNREKPRCLQDTCNELLSSVGARETESLYTDTAALIPDRYIQMCIPEVEYPRSDLPSNIRFAGGLPRGSRDPSTSFPPFWDEIIRISKTKEKKIVTVSQGTFSNLPNQLLLPSIAALSHMLDILVIAILGARNASLPPEVTIPGNVRVADFIPFDDILPYCDVFVTNGGYGAVQHAIANGTPMVIAGSTEEKPENAARVQWAGIGVDLRTGTPTEAMLREAVEGVLSDAGFKERVMGMKEKMEKCDPLAVIAEQIIECGVKCE
jgi:UDP:flavonoid glycosyltransferase YjiC (YdhE family)